MNNIDAIVSRGKEVTQVDAWVIAYRPDPAKYLGKDFTPLNASLSIFTEVNRRNKFIDTLEKSGIYVYNMSSIKILNYMNFALDNKNKDI